MKPLQPMKFGVRRGKTAAVVLSPVNFVFEGDSITSNGYGASANWPTRFNTLLTAAGFAITSHVTAVAGSTMTGTGGSPSVASRASIVDGYFDGAKDNYVFLLDGINDAASSARTQAQIWTDIAAYKAAREAAGWKVIVATQLGYQWGSFSTLNSSIYSNVTRINDFAANPEIGSQTYYKDPFTNDNFHFNENGIAVAAKQAYISFRSFYGLPTVTVVAGFAPMRGLSGTTVQIDGSGFTGATAVTFNGVAATSYTVVNSKQITATVPATADGPVVVTSPTGTDSTSGYLTYLYSSTPAATVTSITPNRPSWYGYPYLGDQPNDTILLNGTNLSNTTLVQFPGPSGTLVTASWGIVNGSQVYAIVPRGASATDPTGQPVSGSLALTCGLNGNPASPTWTFGTGIPPSLYAVQDSSGETGVNLTSIARGTTYYLKGNYLDFAPASLTIGGVANAPGWLGFQGDRSVYFRADATTPTGTRTISYTTPYGNATMSITVT